MFESKLRTTRGKTWATSTSEDFLTKDFLKKIGALLVGEIVYEARKDLAKQGGHPTPRGIAEGIPATERFFQSFYYEVENTNVVVYSSWPLIDQLVDGRRPFPMEWVTQQAGFSTLPFSQGNGTVLIRTTPVSSNKAWIHPGFRKHNFIRRGYQRARVKMDMLLAEQVVKTLSGMDIM